MISLRALRVSDASDVHRICVHPAVARTLGTVPAERIEDWQKRLTEAEPERMTYLGAFERERLLGLAHLHGYPRPRQSHTARIWVAVAPEHWRRGAGKALVGALVDAADAWWPFIRIELDLHADHAAAIGLFGAFEFRIETEKRLDMLRDGELVTGLGMARIRPGFVAADPCIPPASIPPRRTSLMRRKISIRTSRPDDARAMAALHSEPSVMEGTFATPFQNEREWRERIAQSDSKVRSLVAIVEGKLVGSAALLGHRSPRLSHCVGFGISVHPEAQGMGVGDALTGSLLELADRWNGVRRVQLEVFTDNLRAQALYRKHGFEPEGLQRLVAFRRGTYADALAMSRLSR